MRGVAVTTTILAVLTAIVSSRSNNCVAETQLLTSEDAMQWAYFQSKSLKLQMLDVQKNILDVQLHGTINADQKKLIEDKIGVYDLDIAKYNKQKDTIEIKAKSLGRQKKVVGRKGNQFTLSAVLFQIAIMLSSVSALLQRKAMWIIGLVFGCVASVFFVNGFLLFF